MCVEEAAGGPIWDLSPLAVRALTGYSDAGWSERLEVYSEPVDAATPLGACRWSVAGPRGQDTAKVWWLTAISLPSASQRMRSSVKKPSSEASTRPSW